jgi:hypothetical protein
VGRISIPSGDFDAFEARLEEAIPKRPDGTPISVWHTTTRALKAMRSIFTNVINEHDVRLKDLKADVDQQRVLINKVNNVEPRVDRLEEELAGLRSRPF